MVLQTTETDKMDDSWAVVETSQNEFPLIIRVRQKVDTSLRSSRPYKITIIWSVIHGRDNGFPVKMEQLEMERFEDLLVEAFEKDNQAVLMLVYTSAGTREWVFYTKDVDEFSKRLNSIPQEQQKYPIEIFSDTDIGWELYIQERQSLLGESDSD